MKFKTVAVVNYDPHHVILIRRQVNKNKPFEHHEYEGLVMGANQSDYPQVTQNKEDMQKGSTYPMKDDATQPNPLAIVRTPPTITSIASHSQKTNKRDHFF